MVHLSLALLLLLFTACGASTGDEINEDQEILSEPEKVIIKNTPIPLETSLKCPSGTSLSFENFGSSFFSNYCNTCHSVHIEEPKRVDTPLGIDFDTLQGIQIWRANILKTTITQKTMPPDNDVPVEELALLKEWLECGAP